MNDFIALDISGSGMSAQRTRMRVIAENLANQHTTGPDGPYRRKDVLLRAAPAEAPFSTELAQASGRLTSANGEDAYTKVEVAQVRQDGGEPLKVYEPGHPHADAQGYVAYPNVSVFREMTDLVEASRSYEANLAASRATQQMLQSAMELLK